jgi:hypothetical protein
MTLTRYLVFLLISTLICWASWLLVVFRINPTSSGQWGLFFFYLTMFFALAGTSALVGFWVRAKLYKNEVPYRLVAVSFRQGLLMSGVATACAWLQAQRLLAWWTLALVALVAAGIEAFVRASKKPQSDF